MSNEIDFDVFNRTRDNSLSEVENERKAVRKNDKRKKKKAGLIVKICLAVFAVLILATAAAYFISPYHNPERVVSRFVNSVNEENWKGVYKSIVANDSPFVDENDFISYCNENPTAVSLTQSHIVDFEIVKDKSESNNYYYSVNYVDENGASGVLYVTVEKVKERFWIFDRYEVVPDFDCITSVSVYVPQNSSVYIDDYLISKKEKISAYDSVYDCEYSYDKFTADYVLVGSHEVSVTNPQCTESTQSIDTNENTQYFINMPVSEDCYNSLCDKSVDYISQFYSGVINDSIDVSSFPLSQNFSQDRFDGVVNSISEELYKDLKDYNITSMNVTECRINTPYDSTKDIIGCSEMPIIEVRMEFDYDYTSQSIKDDGSELTEDKNDTGQFNIFYTYENGEWKIIDVSHTAWF